MACPWSGRKTHAVSTGTTLLASACCGRNAIGVEIEPAYVRMAEGRIEKELATVFGRETGMASPLPSECGGPAPLPEPNAAATLEGKMGLHP